MKNYDIWFTLEHPANMVVTANSEEEAREIADEMFVDMDQKELLRRIVAAIDYMGILIMWKKLINIQYKINVI